MVAHCLQLLDEDFARDQYQRAQKEFGEISWVSVTRRNGRNHGRARTIDSGPMIPVLEVSAGSSGMAFIGASTFEDETSFRARDHAGFCRVSLTTRGRLKYCASNQVGDAALLYAAMLGPLWQKVKTGEKP